MEEIKMLVLNQDGYVEEIEVLTSSLDDAIKHLGCWENEYAEVDNRIQEYFNASDLAWEIEQDNYHQATKFIN